MKGETITNPSEFVENFPDRIIIRNARELPPDIKKIVGFVLDIVSDQGAEVYLGPKVLIDEDEAIKVATKIGFSRNSATRGWNALYESYLKNVRNHGLGYPDFIAKFAVDEDGRVVLDVDSLAGNFERIRSLPGAGDTTVKCMMAVYEETHADESSEAVDS